MAYSMNTQTTKAPRGTANNTGQPNGQPNNQSNRQPNGQSNGRANDQTNGQANNPQNEQAGGKEKAKRRPVKPATADFVKPTDIVRVRGGIDRPMLVIIILLFCFGAVMVFSASYAYALQYKGDSLYYIKRQLVFGAIGMFAMFCASYVDYRFIRKVTIPVFGVALLMLLAVPFIGQGKGLARRWIYIGPIGFQPSEVMKFALILMLAWYFAKYQYKVTDYTDFRRSSKYGMFYPVFIVGGVCMLIAVENHISGVIIMFCIGMAVIFAGGARKIWFLIFGGGGAAAAALLIAVTGYGKERVDIWLHPENYNSLDETYQTLQGLYAVGSGGIFGVGLGNSQQKHLYVSEPMNDFIFSIICEELGLIGAAAVILLFALFVWRGIIIALRAPDTFSSLVVVGIVAQIALQAMLNMMVVTAMIPNTGISLPFFSSGGTALMMQLGEMGILLAVSRYSYERPGTAVSQ